MKKIICMALIPMIIILGLSACNLKDALSKNAEATPKVEEMFDALSENRVNDAKALMHPEIIATSESGIIQLCDYLDGQKANTIVLDSISVNSSVGTAGKTRQEQLTYKITLNDGSTLNLNVVYLSNKNGSGFTTFNLSIG